ncbi:MAG: TetR/AcrR family transcriptional regulator [Bacilli bacterium]|nr:TetR/AcrR family transcriptional regulator [Bacilli bacterium]MBN2696980.1 TetR/AcrR family transcriptional regulator [Bacilli bacterium]
MEKTREAIINHALELFSERGYEGVSMRDIAYSVGIKAPSIYNHFVSKEDIFNSIIDEMAKRYREMAMSSQIPQGTMEDIVDTYVQVTTEALVAIAQKMLLFMIKDNFAKQYRRLLTIEQYRSEKAGSAYRSFFIDGAIAFESELFQQMMDRGVFIKCDPKIMAYHFYAPIFLMINQFGNMSDAESMALETVKKHVEQFSRIYVKNLVKSENQT